MILTLYIFLVAISLIFVGIGLFRPHDSLGYSLIGFGLLFILSVVMLTGNLEYETGANTNTTYIYDSASRINYSIQDISYDYAYFSDGTSFQMGFWMSILSALGFIFILYNLNEDRKNA